MQFLRPDLLWLLWFAIIPVALYLFRRKSRQVNVSTLVFFKTLAQEHQESAWLRRLKKLLSFLLTILVFLSAVFGISRLINGGSADEGNYRTYVVLLDRSASMALKDEHGTSRLEAARRAIRRRLQTFPQEAGVALVAYDNRPEIIQPRSLIRREFLSHLEEIDVRFISGDASAAIDTAYMLAGLETPALILHASDFGAEVDLANLPEGISLEKINVARNNATNVGVTSFQVRKSPLEQDSFDVHAEVALNRGASETREIHLELYVGGIPSQVRDFELAPGERESFQFKVRGAGGQILRMHLSTEEDAFELDDTILAPLPQTQPIVAVWIRENTETSPADAYTNLALSAIQESGTLELLAGTPAQWPLKNKVDAVIFDGWLPEQWPTDIPAIVINPPGNSGPIKARKLDQSIPYDSIRVGNADHPVLFRVSSSRIALTHTTLFEPSGSFEPLWLAGREPILCAGEIEGQRLVVMAFSPQYSERLPLTASFPLLLGNALLWVTDGPDQNRKKLTNSSTGEFIDVSGKTITWTNWQRDALRKRSFPLASNTIELTRSGIWQTESGQTGTSHLVSIAESDLPVRELENEVQGAEIHSKSSGLVNLTQLLLLIIFCVLLVESWLFHRHAVY